MNDEGVDFKVEYKTDSQDQEIDRVYMGGQKT